MITNEAAGASRKHTVEGVNSTTPVRLLAADTTRFGWSMRSIVGWPVFDILVWNAPHDGTTDPTISDFDGTNGVPSKPALREDGYVEGVDKGVELWIMSRTGSGYTVYVEEWF